MPDYWKVSKLGSICEPITKGTTPSAVGDDYVAQGIVFVKIESIQKNSNINLNRCAFISKETHSKLKRSQLKEGDILFTIAGTLGRLGKVKKHHIPGNTNQAIAIIRIKNNICKRNFLEYFLKTKPIKKQILIEKTIMAQPNLSLKQVSNFKIILPPLNEQQKISSILSNVYNLIDSYDEVIESTTKLKHGLMQHLLTKGIKHKKFKEIQFGVRWMKFQIPLEWGSEPLPKVAKFRQGLQIDKTKRYTQPGKNRIKLIKVLDFYENKDSNEYIDTPSDSKKSVICDEDDIIIARTGNTLGMILTNVHGVFHNNTFALDYNKKLFEKYFFYYFLKSSPVQILIKIISTRTGQPDLTHKEFSILKISIPPIDEQKRIFEILQTTEFRISELELEKSYFEKIKDGLVQKLLTGQIRVKYDKTN